MVFPSFHCWNLSLHFCYPTSKIYFICSNFKNDNYPLEYNALRYLIPNVSLYIDTFYCASSICACMYASSYNLLDQLRLILLIRRFCDRINKLECIEKVGSVFQRKCYSREL